MWDIFIVKWINWEIKCFFLCCKGGDDNMLYVNKIVGNMLYKLSKKLIKE